MRLGWCLLFAIALTVDLFAQSPVGAPRFDVASIRPTANEVGCLPQWRFQDAMRSAG